MVSNVDLFFDNLGWALSLHQGKKLRILATGGKQRNPALPDVPTLQEAGVSAFESTTWFAIVAPPQTPSSITQYLNQQITEVLILPGGREEISKNSGEP